MQDLPTVDLDIVAELKEVMGKDFSLLVASFERDGRQRLVALKAALHSGDAEALRREAHSFKGSSSNLGANQVCNHCMALETLALEGKLDPAVAILDALERCFAKACSVLHCA